ncbi:hypothetical protein [Methylobacterium marchantiae]|uniref:Uncharacterized protein n=1 Tax=Methylobacterium marchantiae TaxID=600331 RepID=A0ABW3WTY2_9HYPH|nr:hypothetical protein AIGOOFII_2994 [Methylobacterium marchantiae]
MLNADPLVARPTLTGLQVLAAALGRIGQEAASPAEVWRKLTESYVVDLDAVASIMPRAEPEPVWLTARTGDTHDTGHSRIRRPSLRA